MDPESRNIRSHRFTSRRVGKRERLTKLRGGGGGDGISGCSSFLLIEFEKLSVAFGSWWGDRPLRVARVFDETFIRFNKLLTRCRGSEGTESVGKNLTNPWPHLSTYFFPEFATVLIGRELLANLTDRTESVGFSP